MPSRRILGIDPGSVRTGYGIVDVRGNAVTPVAWGVIRLDGEATFPDRLLRIHRELSELILLHRPTEAAVEKVFLAKNPSSALKLGQARGAAISALVTDNLPVAEYTALQVKQAVVGHGKAAKEQVQKMVMRLLKLPGVPSADAADALACAIAHAHGGQGMGALATVGRRVKRGRLV